jgi:GntR family transcriptional regulator
VTIGYRQLASTLRAAIEAGEYPPGTTLPKQEELAAQFAVNVKTVRSAVAVLQAEGLVTPVRRRGTVVREHPPMRRLGVDRYAKSKWKFGDIVAFAADREASGLDWAPGDQTNTVQTTPADAEVATGLDIAVGTQVVERVRLVRHEGAPTHLLTSYYRADDVEGTPLTDPTPGPAGRGGGFAVLALQGLEPHRMTESIRARMPTPDEADRLELPPGEPVMILTRCTVTKDGRPVEFARGVHAASRFEWTYTFDLPE